MSRNPDIVNVLNALVEANAAELCVALPGVVQKYDPATQMADIQPALKRTFVNADGDKVVEDYPVIPAVPVVWPRGGGYFLHFPLAAGDGVMLVFADKDPAAWRYKGEITDPGDAGLHGLSGAVAYPGLETVPRALPSGDAATGHAVIGQSGGTQIHIDGTNISLGTAASDYAALASKVNGIFTSIWSMFAAAVPSGTETGLAALQVAFAAAPHASVAATVTKIK